MSYRPKPPTTIKIGPIPFDVIKEPSENSGLMEYEDQRITLNDSMGLHCELETLLHESFHAMLTCIGKEELSDNEGFVQAASNALTALLINNIDLIRYINEVARKA